MYKDGDYFPPNETLFQTEQPGQCVQCRCREGIVICEVSSPIKLCPPFQVFLEWCKGERVEGNFKVEIFGGKNSGLKIVTKKIPGVDNPIGEKSRRQEKKFFELKILEAVGEKFLQSNILSNKFLKPKVLTKNSWVQNCQEQNPPTKN